jgi:hypothetical protein
MFQILSYVSPSLSYRDSGDTGTCYPYTTVPTVKSATDPKQPLVDCGYYQSIEGWFRSRDDGTSCWEDFQCNTWCSSSSRDLFGNCWAWDLRTSCNGCGCIKKVYEERKNGSANLINCSASHPSKQCAQIPGEKTNPGISKTLLSNPQTWSIKSFMQTPSDSIKALINDFVSSKGITPANDSNYAGSKLLYTTLGVVGTISQKNREEIRKSVYYSMYFNFTDPSTVSRQICIGSDPPCNQRPHLSLPLCTASPYPLPLCTASPYPLPLCPALTPISRCSVLPAAG